MLTTLFFPTMVAAFAARPMTHAEQADMAAFFRAAAGRRLGRGETAPLVGLAAGGTAALLLAAGLTWRRRIRSVRLDLLERTKETRR